MFEISLLNRKETGRIIDEFTTDGLILIVNNLKLLTWQEFTSSLKTC